MLTRWGTWIKAAIFYGEHFPVIKKILDTFHDDDSVAIAASKKILLDKSLQKNLAMISTHYAEIQQTITLLETQNLLLFDAISAIKKVKQSINVVPNAIGKQITSKFIAVLAKNEGYKKMCVLNDFLNGHGQLLPDSIQPEAAMNFKYCPVVSVDVERTFSVYKTLLSDRRHNFTLENLEKYLIIYCFKNKKIGS